MNSNNEYNTKHCPVRDKRLGERALSPSGWRTVGTQDVCSDKCSVPTARYFTRKISFYQY